MSSIDEIMPGTGRTHESKPKHDPDGGKSCNTIMAEAYVDNLINEAASKGKHDSQTKLGSQPHIFAFNAGEKVYTPHLAGLRESCTTEPNAPMAKLA